MQPDASFRHLRDQFPPRARALFFARLSFDALGLLIMVVPSFARVGGIQQPFATYWLAGLVAVHIAAYFWVGRPGDRLVVFLSLCVDLLVLVYLVTLTGGLQSPLMVGQVVYTVLFAIIYPTPLAILPPLLTLPVVTKIEQLLGTQTATRDLMLLFWYTAVNIIVVYVVVSLSRREEQSFAEVVRLQQRRRRYALVEERNRIAREMHDGLGAILSSIVIQAEYVLTQLKSETGDHKRKNEAELPGEVEELRKAAQDGMEELRRAVSMMREDFDLVAALEDQCAAISERTRANIAFNTQGPEQNLDPHQQNSCYRVLQEALNNATRHAEPSQIQVTLAFIEEGVALTISDDGKGFDTGRKKSGHYGLATMKERARRAGGDLVVTSKEGDGTTVKLSLPYTR